MLDYVRSVLKSHGVTLVSCISLDECEITRPYLLQRYKIEKGSAVVFAVPYLTRESIGQKNVSAYAVSKDYHLFFKNLFENITKSLKSRYTEYKFAGFCDHSPINEILACAKAGLGVIGKNNLLITDDYSSFVFLGEIITDAPLPSFAGEIRRCIGCKKCAEACPVGMNINECLSSITQKKGELSQSELTAVKKSRCVWGCDICQDVCPYTEEAIAKGTIFTDVDFFKAELTPTLSQKSLENMSEDEFSQRAYSWRGRKPVLRNIKILEEKEH